MNPNAVEPAARQIMGALKRFYDWTTGTATSTGSAGAYALSYSVAPAAYVQGQTFTWKANFTSVGGDTLNVNSLGALGLYKPSSAGPIAVIAGDIQSDQMVTVSYDSALNSSAGGFHVLGGQTIQAVVPPAAVMSYAGSSAPTGWLLANGSCESKTTYAALYAAISDTWTTADSCTTGNFGLPDLRARVVAGYDPSNATGRMTSPVSAATIGNAGGAQSQTIAVTNLPSYNLSTSISLSGTFPFQFNATGCNGCTGLTSSGVNAGSSTESVSISGSVTVSSGGSGTPLTTVQPAIVLNYIIKT